MTPQPPAPKSVPAGSASSRGPKLTVERWVAIVSTLIALGAMVVAILSYNFSREQDRMDREEQRAQQATSEAVATLQQATSQAVTTAQQATSQAVATVQQATVQAAETSDAALRQELVSIKRTQTASEADQAKMLRLQVFPFMHTIGGDPAVLTLTDARIITDTGGALLIRGMGQISATLANDGGAKAGLTTVRWVGERADDRLHDLRVENVAIWSSGVTNPPPSSAAAVKGVLRRPLSIEGQSALRVNLDVTGEIKADKNLTTRTTYQLGRILSDTLQAAGTNLVFQFSNTEPLIVTLRSMSLSVPVQAIRTDPASPFLVTEADETGIVCIVWVTSTMQTSEQLTVTLTAPREEPPATIALPSLSPQCMTLPLRDEKYQLRAQVGGTQRERLSIVLSSKELRIDTSEELAVELQYNTSGMFPPRPPPPPPPPCGCGVCPCQPPPPYYITPTPIPGWHPAVLYDSLLSTGIAGLVMALATVGTLLLWPWWRLLVQWRLSRSGFDLGPRSVELRFSVLRPTQSVRLDPNEPFVLRLRRDRVRGGYVVTLLRGEEAHPSEFVTDEELIEATTLMLTHDLSVTLKHV